MEGFLHHIYRIMAKIINKIVNRFIHGTIDSYEPVDIPIKYGVASKSKNWITASNKKLELRRGMYIVKSASDTRNTGTNKITGSISLKRQDGTWIRFRTRARKIEYRIGTGDWTEIGTNTLPAIADGEDITFSAYRGLAGDQLFLSSPNSGLYKIMLANPGSVTNVYDASYNYKGYISIVFNRMFLWARKKDKATPYMSFIDEQNYTTITDESVDTGDGGKTYSGTLAFKAGGAKRTCFAVVINDEDSNEIFIDNNDGTLTGDAGGKGTINYTTGAWTVIFNANVTTAKDIRSTYQWEDTNDGGITDFTYSGTRVAGEGNFFLQGVGGNLQAMPNFKNIYYCLHEKQSYQLALTNDDTNAVNEIFREKVGIPNHRAAKATGDGIFLINTFKDKEPKFQIIEYSDASEAIVLKTISKNVNLSNYKFDKGVVEEHGENIIFVGRSSSDNDRAWVYNRNENLLNPIDMVDYPISCLSVHAGVLEAGDSLTPNTFELFSGFDDDDAVIDNYWESILTNLEIEALKKDKRLRLKGEIGIDQSYRVYFNIDNSGYVEVGNVIDDDSIDHPAIEGSGPYVDKGQKINVGSMTIGRSEIGGGGDAVDAYRYYKEIKLKLGKFENCKIKFIAQGIGYVGVSKICYHDIRIKRQRLPSKYR